MRIVYCIDGLHNHGGMERITTFKANYFAEKLGYEVHIIVKIGKDRSIYFPLSPVVKLHYLELDYDIVDYSSLFKRVFHVAYLDYLMKKRLDKCLNQINPDVIVFTNLYGVGYLASRNDGSIKIAESHFNKEIYIGQAPFLRGYFPNFTKRMYLNHITSLLSKLDKLVVLTYEDAEAWTELKNVTVVPNPITITPDGTSLCENKRVIAVGRYVHQKGFDMLLDAWKIVSEKHKDWTLHIYGDGSLREELEQQRKSLGLESSCFLEHTVKEIGECLKNSSLLVLSSRYEGFGLVLVEAMSCGLPVVSFACPCGPKDIIHDGEDGFLVEPNNVEELASKISYLIENDEDRKRMGHQASINVHRFDIDRVAAMWKQLFEELLKEKNRQ